MTSPWQLINQMASHRPGEWLRDALCAEIGAVDFFPGKCESAEPAKRICRMCDVRVQCAEYAITSPVTLHGIWGGMSFTERQLVRRQKNIPDGVWVEEHGTEAAHKRHQRAGEKPCRACSRAATEARHRRERA